MSFLSPTLRRTGLRLDPEAALRLVAEGASLIDVGWQDDDSLPAATRIPPDEIPGHLGRFRRDVPIVLACT